MIAVKKLDGAIMHLNEDLIERVEGASDGQSAIYLRDGRHMVLANEPEVVVEMIRAERAALLQRAFDHSESAVIAPISLSMSREITPLTQVPTR